MSGKVLIIHNNDIDFRAIKRFYNDKKLVCLFTDNCKQGFYLCKKHKTKIVFIDLIMPKMNGIEFMEKIIKDNPDVYVIIYANNGSIETAVEAIKKGAYNYITRPVNIDNLSIMVDRIIKHQEVLKERDLFQAKVEEIFGANNFIGESVMLKNIFRQIKQVAQTDSTIVITGESGTGKELCANAIHYSSNRKGKPFIKLNCAALPETLIESELFGHEKGSFTSAGNQRIGRFEQANGGTLFLDEVGDIPISTQTKLLRFLESKEFERVGGNETIKVDVRLISATNRKLDCMRDNNSIRGDLYYRLNVTILHSAPSQ